MLAIQEARIGATKKGGAPDSTPPTNESRSQQIIAQEPENETLRALTERQKARAGRYWPLAQKYAWKLSKRFGFAEIDWDGVAAIGLVQASKKYRKRGGAKFKTFLYSRVKGACIDALRSARRKGYGRYRDYRGAPKIWPLQEAIWVFTSARMLRRNRRSFKVLTAAEDPIGWEIESEEEVRRLTDKLPPREGEVVRKLYLWAEPAVAVSELSKELKVCRSRISQLHTSSLKRLRHEIEAGKGRAA